MRNVDVALVHAKKAELEFLTTPNWPQINILDMLRLCDYNPDISANNIFYSSLVNYHLVSRL